MCTANQPMFTRMGIPGGVKRYMDVITVALLCRNPSEVTAAEAFVSELNKPAVHPSPLCLNMEPQGNQEFLEANVTVSGGQLALSINNKVTTDILYRLPPYRQRLSNKVSRAANRAVLSGSFTRTLQSTSDDELITMCILALSYETQHHKLNGCLIRQVISRARNKARERKGSEAERALAKASPALEKQRGGLGPWLVCYAQSPAWPIFAFLASHIPRIPMALVAPPKRAHAAADK